MSWAAAFRNSLGRRNTTLSPVTGCVSLMSVQEVYLCQTLETQDTKKKIYINVTVFMCVHVCVCQRRWPAAHADKRRKYLTTVFLWRAFIVFVRCLGPMLLTKRAPWCGGRPSSVEEIKLLPSVVFETVTSRAPLYACSLASMLN